jgi:hypothetical protein
MIPLPSFVFLILTLTLKLFFCLISILFSTLTSTLVSILTSTFYTYSDTLRTLREVENFLSVPCYDFSTISTRNTQPLQAHSASLIEMVSTVCIVVLFVLWCGMVWCGVVWCCIVLCYVTLYHVILCYVMYNCFFVIMYCIIWS